MRSAGTPILRIWDGRSEMEIWYNLLLWTVQAFMMLFTSECTMKRRGSLRFHAWLLAAVLAADAVFGWIKLVSAMNSPVFMAATAVSLVLYLVYCILGFTDRLWRRVMVYILVLMIGMVSDLLVIVLFRASGNTGILHMKHSVSVNIVVTMVQGVLYCLTAFIMNRVFPRGKQISYFLLFLLFPMSQLMLCFSADWQNVHGGVNRYLQHPLSFAGFLLGVAADLWLMYLMLWNERREKIQRENEELKHLRELEKAHFDAVEEKQNAFAKFRHDYRNQMMTVLTLIEQGQADKAAENLHSLSDLMGQTGDPERCSANDLINAVMSEKAGECRRLGIRLKTELNVGLVPGIEPVHLCSVFSNLMDNAIHAAAEMADGSGCAGGGRTAAGEIPFIEIRAAVRGEYLTVRAENSSPDPDRKQRTRKGYGREILNDIAGHYDGDYRGSWQDGVYTAIISLHTAESGLQ